MSRKIVGVTVGTPMSPQKVAEKLEGLTTLPTVTEEDNGKVLQVKDGGWVAEEPPTYEGGEGKELKIDKTLKFDAEGALGVNTTEKVEGDNTLPISSAAVHVAVGNIEAILETI